MTTAMSKRTQLRNEKALHDLVKTVPGNERCADCEARNPGAPPSLPLPSTTNHPFPGWASWSVSSSPVCHAPYSLRRKNEANNHQLGS